MSVFGLAVETGGRMMCDAAIDAAYELGIFDALAGSSTLDELAAAIGVPAGHRLRALVDVLAAVGAIERRDPAAGSAIASRDLALGAPPRPSAVIRAGWGLVADVIRRDRPLADTDDPELVRRMHRHLVDAGAPAARELVALVASRAGVEGSLVDLGGGAGAYTAAYLDRCPAARATLVDTPEVVALAAEHLARFGDRARLVAGDAREPATTDGGHGWALLANVLHLHSPASCAALCDAAARAVAPGGLVVVHDLRVDRDGPLESLLFALGMAIYTDDGDVYDPAQLRTWLADAGLESIEERRLDAAPNSIVLIGRRARAADSVSKPSLATELDARLARTATAAWQELARDGLLRDPHARAPSLRFPTQLRAALVGAIAGARDDSAFAETSAVDGHDAHRATAADLIRHYTETMPRMRVALLASVAEPAATLFHTRLDWSRLPRLGSALDRLFAILARAGVDATAAVGAGSADALRARTPTLAALYERTHYGGVMPLLYGYPADLAYFVSRGLDVQQTIDRYLTAPIVHELCHFSRDRDALCPHLDECIGGWLGVYVHPELAYPAPGHDDALYAAPWLAQVGQAVARAFGIHAVLRAQAGAARWEDATSVRFVEAAQRIGRADWRARRTLHLLSDTFDPAPWVVLAFAARAGRTLDDETCTSIGRLPLTAISPPEDRELDRDIVADALRAMCLDNVQIDGSFRARTRLPGVAIEIDAGACRVTRPLAGPMSVDRVAPAYWLPPAVATTIAARELDGYALWLRDIDAIPAAADAICAASADLDHPGFELVGHRRRSVPDRG